MGREVEFRFWSNEGRILDWQELRTLHVGTLFDKSVSDRLMQFTGLRDKNGVKIFEGDIVDFNGGDICEVFFENGCFWAGNEQLSKHPIGQWLHYSESAVVIGNIHQHPRLLEK